MLRRTYIKRKRDKPRRRLTKPRKRSSPRRSKPHRDWIASQPCAICGASNGVCAAHLRWHTDGGMGLKPSDFWTWPGCHKCHIVDQHNEAEPPFFSSRHINPWRLCLSYARRSPVDQIREAAEQIMLPHIEQLAA